MRIVVHSARPIDALLNLIPGKQFTVGARQIFDTSVAMEDCLS